MNASGAIPPPARAPSANTFFQKEKEPAHAGSFPLFLRFRDAASVRLAAQERRDLDPLAIGVHVVVVLVLAGPGGLPAMASRLPPVAGRAAGAARRGRG